MNVFAKIVDGVVVNRAAFESTLPDEWPDRHVWVAGEESDIGWSYVDGKFVAPIEEAPPVPVTTAVSRRQLILGLAGMGLITGDEALAAAQIGAVPAGIDAYFSMLPDDQALAARITWASMTEARRDHPLIAALADANKLSSEQIDDAFRAWALI